MFRITYLVDDKHLAPALRQLTGIARELHVEPVVNAVRKGNEVHAKTDGAGYQSLLDYMTKTNMTEISGSQAKAAMTQLGLEPTSYSYHIQEALRRKLLKKAGKAPSGNGLRYARVMLRKVK